MTRLGSGVQPVLCLVSIPLHSSALVVKHHKVDHALHVSAFCGFQTHFESFARILLLSSAYYHLKPGNADCFRQAKTGGFQMPLMSFGLIFLAECDILTCLGKTEFSRLLESLPGRLPLTI